ncbi:MAG: transposase [Gemmatales bacterium]
MKRHEVSDTEWAFLEPLLPHSLAKTGRPPRDLRVMLNGTMWILSTGAPWRDLPVRFGPWQTVYHHFTQWRDRGVLDRILDVLHVRLDKNGYID